MQMTSTLLSIMLLVFRIILSTLVRMLARLLCTYGALRTVSNLTHTGLVQFVFGDRMVYVSVLECFFVRLEVEGQRQYAPYPQPSV